MRFQFINNRKRQLGLTNAALAEKTGINLSTLDKITSGANQNPKLDTLQKIADALECTLDDFCDNPRSVHSLDTSRNYMEIGIFGHREPRLNDAATAATKVLIDQHVAMAPVDPMCLLMAMPDVFVVTFTEMADEQRLEQDSSPSMFGSSLQDAVSYSMGGNGRLRVVAYNQRMPHYILQMALARELGHIMLGHDRAHLDEADTMEALYFARHLLCPRPLIRALMDKGLVLSVEAVGNFTGCYGRTLAGIRSMPGARVPAAMNRRLRAQFALYIDTILDYQQSISEDAFTPADFGSYLDNYEE